MSCVPPNFLKWPSPNLGYAVRKPSSSSTPEFWLDPKGKIITAPPGPAVQGRPNEKIFGSCWLSADASGNPVEPSGAAVLPDHFESDPLNPDISTSGSGSASGSASGNPAIKIVFLDELVALAAQNAVLIGSGGARRFDLSDASCRWFTPTQTTLPFQDATPHQRPFYYPAGAASGSSDRSVLADIARSLPKPTSDGELHLPSVPAPQRVVSRSLSVPLVGGLDCYKVGLRPPRGTYIINNQMPCAIPRGAGYNASFNKNLTAWGNNMGTWVGPSIGLCVGAGEMSTLSSSDPRCIATVYDWSSNPASERQIAWQEDGDADLTTIVETAGLPSRIFTSTRPSERLPDNGTAFDLLLVLAVHRWVRVEANLNVMEPTVVETDRGITMTVDATWYTLSQSEPADWNVWVWGQFRQIVPVAPVSNSSPTAI